MEDSEGILSRFNRLMRDLENGATGRTCFRSWEVELLLDFDSCDLPKLNRRRILHRYRGAVRRQLECGATRPLTLTEYLERIRGNARPALS